MLMFMFIDQDAKVTNTKGWNEIYVSRAVNLQYFLTTMWAL